MLKIKPVHRNLIQMFDACTKKYDHRNAQHLACTEIRKANLAYCNYNQAVSNKGVFGGGLAIKDRHKECVRDTAKQFMHHFKFVPKDVASKAVDKVFDKCYSDLEPIGRRCPTAVGPCSFLCDYEKTIFGHGNS